MSSNTTQVWFFEDEDNAISAYAYPTLAAAQQAALEDLKAIDPGGITGEEVYTWRTTEKLPGRYFLDEDGRFTGWVVWPVTVLGA